MPHISSNNRNTLALIAALFGNMIEYFDFTIYGIFVLSISQEFFAPNANDGQLLWALSVFAVGFLTRPIGGIFFGYLGTSFGRRTSLLLSSALMSLSTLSIGLLPSYAQIGAYSTWGLIMARLIQGLCVSGEGISVAVYVLETTQTLRKGLVTGITHASNVAGTLLAGIVGIYLLQSEGELWRIGFIIGGILSLIGMCLRFFIVESKVFHAQPKNNSNILTNFYAYHKNFILVATIGGLAASVMYLAKCYLGTALTAKGIDSYIGQAWHIYFLGNITPALYTSLIALMVTIMMPIAGALNDQYKTQNMLSALIVILILGIIPIFVLLHQPNSILELIGLILFSALNALLATTSYIFCLKLFPANVRFLNLGFAYNTGVALLGGTTPAISQQLITLLQVKYAPGIYVMLLGLLVILLRKSFNLKLYEL